MLLRGAGLGGPPGQMGGEKTKGDLLFGVVMTKISAKRIKIKRLVNCCGGARVGAPRRVRWCGRRRRGSSSSCRSGGVSTCGLEAVGRLPRPCSSSRTFVLRRGTGTRLLPARRIGTLASQSPYSSGSFIEAYQSLLLLLRINYHFISFLSTLPTLVRSNSDDGDLPRRC